MITRKTDTGEDGARNRREWLNIAKLLVAPLIVFFGMSTGWLWSASQQVAAIQRNGELIEKLTTKLDSVDTRVADILRNDTIQNYQNDSLKERVSKLESRTDTADQLKAFGKR